jgi:dipeptidyl aminopeptidase/acylaminoacyl peptidase
MALPFDAANRKVLGPPVPVLNGIRQEAEAGAGQFTIARDGTLLYAPGTDAGRSVLVSLDMRGNLDTLPFPAAGYNGFELSPDGKQILIRVQSASGRAELWVFDIDRGAQTRIPTDGIPLHIPRWWPDGKQILFSEFTRRGGLIAPVIRERLDGLSHRDTLLAAAMSAVPAPDGHHIAATGLNNKPGLWLLPVDGSTDKPVQLSSESLSFTSFSPDGKWIVYHVSDPPEVYVSSVERPQLRYKISSSGGEEPLWSPKGDRIVYRNGQQWLAVDVSTKDGFNASKARVVFEGPYLNVPGWSHSFFPDGERQLLLLGPQEQTSNRFVAVTNWFAELRRLAPAGRN